VSWRKKRELEEAKRRGNQGYQDLDRPAINELDEVEKSKARIPAFLWL